MFVFAVVCPGQGAQKPGMLSEWLKKPGVEARVAHWSEISKIDLITHGTTSDADTIKNTAIAQPLIVAASLLAWQHLVAVLAQAETKHLADLTKTLVAGHSVGEFAAAAIAGIITDDEVMSLVAERGRLMAECAGATPTGMSAVIGGTGEEAVIAAITAAGLTPANINSNGQIVAAGDKDALATLAANPPEKTRVIPLAVAGAFHTHYMEKARIGLAGAASHITPHNPQPTLLSNKDGQAITVGHEYVDRLVSQVTNPVHWTACMSTMAQSNVTGMIELAPSGVLLGLAKRDLHDVARLGVDSPENIPDAANFTREHLGLKA